jgi:pantoate--beta-alanine ligase
MIVARSIADLRTARGHQPPGTRVGLVPTMGAFHAGHVSLFAAARRECDVVVVSLFVNPSQFGDPKDLETYPRDQARDAAMAEAAGADVLFTPSVDEIYPPGFETRVDLDHLSLVLEGAFRPGHFRGVATVVMKLFNMVSPHIAIFGKKDYQQYVVLRDMVKQLALPVEIVPAETVRADDGLALSSRNGYLSPAERAEAPRLYRCLRAAADEVVAGKRDFRRIELQAMSTLANKGWRPDYVSVRRQADLQPPGSEDRNLVVLAAAFLGRTRLIDNVEVTL